MQYIFKRLFSLSTGLLILALNLSAVNSDPQKTIFKINALNQLSQQYSEYNAELSYKYALSALTLSASIKYSPGSNFARINIGTYYFSQRQYIEALKIFYSVYDSIKSSGDKKIYSLLNLNLGRIYCHIKRYNNAKLYFERAIVSSQRSNDTIGLMNAYIGMGVLYEEIGDFSQASKYLNLTFYLSLRSNNLVYQSKAYRFIGILYLDKNNVNSAQYFFEKAIGLELIIGNHKELGTLYTHIGHIYQNRGDLALAIRYNQIALLYRKKEGQRDQQISSLFNLGYIYLEENNLDSAYYYITQGFELLKSNELFHVQQQGYELLYFLYLKEKKYSDALSMYTKYKVVSDSINSKIFRLGLADLQFSHELRESEQNNSLLRKENQIQGLEIKNKNRSTIILLLLISVFLILIIVFTWLYLKTKRSREALERLNKQLDKEINDRKQAEINLKVSEASYRFLADNTPDLIVHMDSRNRLVYISPNCPQVLGYPIDEMMERFDPLLIIHPEYHEAMKGLYEDMVSSGEPTLFTYEALRKDGSLFWVESLAKPLFDLKTGRFNGTLIVNRDIAERVKYEEQLSENARQKEVLLREIHHRVKNNFAILAGVMTLQRISAENKELTNLINDLQTRIRSMSLVHELLYKNDNLDVIPFDIYLMQLSNIVASGNRSKPVSLIYNLEPCVLDIEIVLPLGLVVTELLTNAFKYAFTGTGPNELTLELAIHETDDKNNPVKWKLILRDNGKGLPEGFSMENVTTLGTSIVNMLVTQVEGTVAARNENGACFEIIFNNYIEKSSRLNDRK